ncbi:TPA: hypothetical protein N0F65_004779 [Lagenidium giganteum]|uniref:Fungal lipase-like domain-containing protein n=1 Tax=Lagenidium giganteum TaxID=4803 RepID=A0AAV2Z9U9_9STRA|nr:TPA: hypothetical protein N0F65_004779 [Lagenidium giganteum]
MPALRSVCLGVLARWEALVRACVVDAPALVFQCIPNADKAVSVFFVYVMLQALALLWPLLGNVASVLGENMMTIITMPVSQAGCVLGLYASVVALIFGFGRAMWVLTWQSTDNFPQIRRLIASECRPQTVIFAAALPMLFILPSLMLVPFVCADDTDHGSVNELLPRHWHSAICQESYLRFISPKYPACIELLPSWRVALTGASTRAIVALGGSLLLIKMVGGLWFIEWIARHSNHQLTPLHRLAPAEWEFFGMALLIAAIAWSLTLTWQTRRSVGTYHGSQGTLNNLFGRLKYTFVLLQLALFVRGCVHPQMGFVHAQLELTIINILLPTIYVISFVMLRLIALSSLRAVAFSVPFATITGALIFNGTGVTNKPHSLVVLVVFLYIVGLRVVDHFEAVTTTVTRSTLHGVLHPVPPQGRAVTPGRRVAKVIVFAGILDTLSVTTQLSGFSILSVVQSKTQWYPDTTSVHYHSRDVISVHHTSAVKLHLGLANESASAMHIDEPDYATCGHRWHGLDLVDYSLIAQAAYFNPQSNDTSQFLETMFNPSLSVPVQVRMPPLNSKTGGKFDFYEVFFPSLNTSVVAVRGTDVWRFTDMIENHKMSLEPVSFAILSTIFPTIRIWPDITSSTIIELYHEVVSLLGLEHKYWYYRDLLKYVESIQDRQVVLTGHSLGGGFVQHGSFIDAVVVPHDRRLHLQPP